MLLLSDLAFLDKKPLTLAQTEMKDLYISVIDKNRFQIAQFFFSVRFSISLKVVKIRSSVVYVVHKRKESTNTT